MTSKSRLISRRLNRRTDKGFDGISIGHLDSNILFGMEDFIKQLRKKCVAERLEFLDLKKQHRCKSAKEMERVWLQRERAATLLINREEGPSLDTYDWPIELAPALEFVIDACWSHDENTNLTCL